MEVGWSYTNGLHYYALLYNVNCIRDWTKIVAQDAYKNLLEISLGLKENGKV